MQKHLFILIISIFIIQTKKLNAQNIFGKYIENNSDSLLFKGILILKADSIFTYEGVGTLKDDASGKFTVKKNILYLKYDDGCSNNFLKRNKVNPIELLGLILACEGRPKKLIYENKNLYFIIRKKEKSMMFSFN